MYTHVMYYYEMSTSYQLTELDFCTFLFVVTSTALQYHTVNAKVTTMHAYMYVMPIRTYIRSYVNTHTHVRMQARAHTHSKTTRTTSIVVQN